MSDLSVAARLESIRGRMADACRRAGRDPAEVVLVGAGKRQPLERLQEAAEAGLRVVGENRVQEADAKIPLLPSDLDWHLIGPLQTNKARRAVQIFSTVHSLDRPKLARVLDREARRAERSLGCFLEINLGAEETKHGFAPTDVAQHLQELLSLEHLELLGLMAIPPYEPDLGEARRWFGALRRLRNELAAAGAWGSRPGWLSMGMSHDFEAAIAEGATHVRVGSALFGAREVPG